MGSYAGDMGVFVIDVQIGASYYLYGLTLIETWKGNHMPSKVWDENNMNYQTSTNAPFTFGNVRLVSNFISNFIHFILNNPS